MRRGLYIHVPFCKSRCIYCDFYSTTCGEAEQAAYVDALAAELGGRRGYLDAGVLDSVYLGGGTPSVLGERELNGVMEAVRSNYSLSDDAEVTIEVNPDDVTPEYARRLSALSINRVSMGVQSFDDEQLRRLCRRHTASQVDAAVSNLLRAGIDNISIDLIYGLPNQDLDAWRRDVDRALALPVSHLSAYALIYEEGTALYAMREKGLVCEADEELSLLMYETLMLRAAAEGMNHYEISNFARPGCEARHNSGYWRGMHYIGVGPGAHSYNGRSRQWNNGDLRAYIAARGDVEGRGLCETEVLSRQMMMEESLLTSLRTASGLDVAQFAADYGQEVCESMMRRAQRYLRSGHLTMQPSAPAAFVAEATEGSGNYLCLTRKGLFISDDIISTLFE